MRKSLLFPLMMICMSISSSAFAQTSVNLYMANAPQYNPCIVPQDVMFNYYGHATGYLPTDIIALYANWGDGTDTVIYRDSVYTSFYGNITHFYSFPGIYSTLFILTGPDGMADTLINMDQVVLSGTCGNITGTAYADSNGNCTIDAGEALLQGVTVRLLKNGLLHAITTTDTLGNYAFHVPVGVAYDVQVDTNYMFGYTFSCPTGGIHTGVNPPASGVNFGFICNHPGFDLTGYIYGSGFRPNFNAYVNVYVQNHYCNAQNGQIKLVLDPKLHFISCTPPAFAVIGDTVIWNHSSIVNNHCFWAGVIVHTDPTAVVGDSVRAEMFILPVAGDQVPGNNIIHKKFPVRNSWDPNMKYVTPAGTGVNGYIPLQTKLEYTIFFQNTGNDFAHNIFIMDTLDSDLDVSSFQLLSSSHDVETFLLSGNILKFAFNHIMLPDSGTDLVASQGYVTFTITPKSMLANGTPILNTAYIYFDNNPAVKTNEVLNTIDLTVGTNEVTDVPSVMVFPNPMHSQAVFQILSGSKASGITSLSVFDMTGKQVKNINYNAGEQILLDREGLSNGVFYYRLSDKQSNILGSGKLIVL